MAKIPIKGVNPALKKFAEKAAKKANVDDAIEGVRKTMAETARRAKPVQEVINDSTGVTVARKANGRRDIKSAKESASIFVDNGRAMDSPLAEQIGLTRELLQKQRLNEPLTMSSSDQLLKNMNDSRGPLREKIKERRQIEKEIESVFGGSKESASIFSNDTLMNDYQKRHKVTDNDLNMREKQKNLKEELLKKKEARQNKSSSNISTAATSPGDNWVYKAAAAGVGGGLVLSMASNKGQQSNSQLYGQRGY